MTIGRLLVANRGEIARRIMLTCREMAIETVAVYSEADKHASFVADADLAVPIGGPTPGDSYLRADRIIEAAKLTDADAIHPGYGFLSENAEFARAVVDAGLIWVGPPPAAIDAMGSKISAKSLMAQAGVPMLPSVELVGINPDDAAVAVEPIGFPLLIKAASGGGGRGMRIVATESELTEAVEGAVREAESAFGDGTIYAEKYVSPSKHVEVQIFGDDSGNVVHFGERECSVQRRHQKVIEEAPSPSIDGETRSALHAAAVSAGEAIGYTNAGTVEFLLDPDGGFYFLEVNTRLQVEHPVTEAVHGVDLVRLQLDVAAGARVPPQTELPQPTGHAIEARIYAEDPTNDYLPSIGDVSHFAVGRGVRVDAAFDTSGTVTEHYDAMIAKVISRAPTRDQAIRKLCRALRQTALTGIAHNVALLVRTLEHEGFESGGDTDLLEREGPAVLGRPLVEGAALARSLVAAALSRQASRRREAAAVASVNTGFRNVFGAPQSTTMTVHGTDHLVEYRFERGRLVHAAVDGEPLGDLDLISCSPHEVELVVEGIRQHFAIACAAGSAAVQSSSGVVAVSWQPRFLEPTDEVAEGSLVATMPGTVRSVAVVVGDEVEAGQQVVVMEAMKMEMSIAANGPGTILEVNVQPGDTVEAGTVLVVIE